MEALENSTLHSNNTSQLSRVALRKAIQMNFELPQLREFIFCSFFYFFLFMSDVIRRNHIEIVAVDNNTVCTILIT